MTSEFVISRVDLKGHHAAVYPKCSDVRTFPSIKTHNSSFMKTVEIRNRTLCHTAL